MPVAQTLGSTTYINESGTIQGPADRWDGYSYGNFQPQFTASLFAGYYLDWGGFQHTGTLSPFDNQPYAGYTTNFAGTELPPALNSFLNVGYAGYTTNWGARAATTDEVLNDVDNNTIIDHPKNQKIYFKLRGRNVNTNTYETWIITEEITSRPETFDPGRNPPNYMLDIYTTPQSNNNLTDIIIIGRWIE